MSSDDTSPQAGQKYNSNSSNDSPRALNTAVANYNKLYARPESIVKPDLFTLYFGFFGTAAWSRRAAGTVNERVENHYVLTARSPTQDEFDAIVEHGTRCLYQGRMGLPISSFLGTAFLYNQARKSPMFPRNPTPASLLSTVRTMWSDVGLRGNITSAAFKMVFIITLGTMASSAYAVSNDAMHMLTDPRLKGFIEDVRKAKPEDVRKRKIQAANARLRGMRSGEQDVGSQMRQAIGTPGDYAGGDGYEQEQASDSPAQPNSYSEYVNSNDTQGSSQSASYESSKSDSNGGAVWARGRSTQPESKSSLDFMDEDDASPTAAEYRNTNIDGSPTTGSAWDRIRRQNAGARSQPRQQPGMAQPSLNPYSSSAEFGQSDQEKYDTTQKTERDQAQAEFDRMIEAERNVGSEGSSRNRGWGS
ncbi:hypothetical protein N7471_005739 [Penicillium samsonianum]|uniref:uncharacterized protein n=1 Tax=Penicillium samsonianum TaxID=1882272 RepID=UPI002549B874|nr:uncharacterized protein N7471_005739 [Penicillium samsonianum]KAJ6139253.1 hypothetical protein N7471_005739 [Penicillium samsonianum]